MCSGTRLLPGGLGSGQVNLSSSFWRVGRLGAVRLCAVVFRCAQVWGRWSWCSAGVPDALSGKCGLVGWSPVVNQNVQESGLPLSLLCE